MLPNVIEESNIKLLKVFAPVHELMADRRLAKAFVIAFMTNSVVAARVELLPAFCVVNPPVISVALSFPTIKLPATVVVAPAPPIVIGKAALLPSPM